jgi:hypothetical protein
MPNASEVAGKNHDDNSSHTGAMQGTLRAIPEILADVAESAEKICQYVLDIEDHRVEILNCRQVQDRLLYEQMELLLD